MVDRMGDISPTPSDEVLPEIGHELGVIIVTFNSGSEAVDCVETLLSAAAAADVALRVVLVDNASGDDTVARLRDWASGKVPYIAPADLPFIHEPVPKPLSLAEGDPDLSADPMHRLTLIQTGLNRGFAGGVNVGLSYLAQFPALGHFWVINPDSVVPTDTVGVLAARLADPAPYALMGGRVLYYNEPETIQIDGGTVNWCTGVTSNLGHSSSDAATPPPDLAQLDFIMGANMVASRAFYNTVGPMREEYFLYYEEVDWALRRGALPLAYCPGFRIHHRAGSSIGSPLPGRAASPFSLYFKHRSRMKFLRRFKPRNVPVAMAYTLAYAVRLLLYHWSLPHVAAVLRGGFGLTPPRQVRDRLSPEAAAVAFDGASAR